MTQNMPTRALGTSLSRRGFLLAGGGTAAALLAGCGGGQGVGSRPSSGGGAEFTGTYDGPAVTLDYWNGFTGGDGPTMQAMLKAFNSEQKNITVKNNTVDWADFYQRLPAAAKAGRGPEVGVMHLDQLATNAARQVIVPLDDVAEEIGLEESDFTPAVWQPGIYNDSRYGIPLDVHSLAMYWNKEHFDKAGITDPPTDAASLEEAIGKLQDAGFRQPFWMPGQWPAHLMFFSLLWQNGGEPYNEDGSEATFGSDEGIEALSWMREQVDKGYSPANVDRDAQYLAFLGEAWDEGMLAHGSADSPFRDATRFAQNPEALGAVSTASIGRWQRDLDARDRRVFKRIAGPLLVELGYAGDERW